VHLAGPHEPAPRPAVDDLLDPSRPAKPDCKQQTIEPKLSFTWSAWLAPDDERHAFQASTSAKGELASEIRFPAGNLI